MIEWLTRNAEACHEALLVGSCASPDPTDKACAACALAYNANRLGVPPHACSPDLGEEPDFDSVELGGEG